MRKPLLILVTLAAATAGPMAHAYDGEELAPKARIAITRARTLALKAHRGTIIKEELEAEPGGSGLRYSFDIRDAKGSYEVGIDAKNGKVLENKLEGPNPD